MKNQLIELFLMILLLFSCSSKEVKQEIIEEVIPKETTVDTNIIPKNIITQSIETEEDTIEILSILMKEYFPNCTFYHYQSGNLDRDNQNDVIVILEKKCDTEDEKATDESRCRKVVFLKNNTFPNYEIATTNDKIITCSDCGYVRSMPQIVIKNGYISFENLFGGCDKTFEVITFKYDSTEKDWFLHRIGTENYSCREEDNPNNEIQVRTTTQTKKSFGLIRFKDFDDQ